MQSVGLDSFDFSTGFVRAVPNATLSVVTIKLEDLVYEECGGK